MSQPFYSARLVFAILVDNGRPRRRQTYNESVVVFRARSFAHAFKRALALGRAAETQYPNRRGQAVRWALTEVLNLDRVGSSVDGREVASRLYDRVAPKRVRFGSRFRPERSRPGQSF